MRRNVYVNSEEGYPKYYELKYGWSRDYKLESDFIISHLPDSNFPRILEVGCGIGGHVELVANAKISVDGIDKNPFVLSEAKVRKATSLVRYFCVDFKSSHDLSGLGSYDLIYSLFSVFQRFSSIAHLVEALSCCYHHLNTPGLLILEFLNPIVYYRTYSDTRIRRVRMLYDSDIAGRMFARNFLYNGLEHIIVYYYIHQGNDRNYFIDHHVLKFFSFQEISKALSTAGYHRICLYGDYAFSDFEESLSKHIIAVASKGDLHAR